MSDDFEDLLKRWLRDRAGNDRSALQALAGNVAVLPPRRRNRRTPLAVAATILVIVGLIAFAAPRTGQVASQPEPSQAPSPSAMPAPGGPEAFANDPRLATCTVGLPTDMEFVFEMTHARDYHRYFPAMLQSPELDVDDPALTVVYREGYDPPYGGLPGAEHATPEPGRRIVCVVIGRERTVYGDVDITGLTIDVVPSSSAPTTLVDPSPRDPTPSATAMPAPAWVVDLAGQLECDGPIANLGGEYPDSFGRPDPLGDSPEASLALFLGPGNPFASLPTAGFIQLHREPHWASFGHLVDGRAKAIILLSDTTEFGAAWSVVGLRACDASEFDPNVPLTFPVTIWTNASGDRVSTETIRSAPGPGHCGWETSVWLTVKGALYFRDPDGVMAEWTKTRFDSDAQLPASAVDSGYRSGEWSLWLDPRRDAYLVSAGRVERWPRSSDPFIGCM